MTRKDDWAWQEGGGDWGNFGLVCLLCGEKFYGGADNAMKPLLAHSSAEHMGERVDYAGFATPLSQDAKKRAGYLTSINEAVKLRKIEREHGTGWYFYALHYGVAEALARIQDLEGQEVQTLRERVQMQKASQEDQ